MHTASATGRVRIFNVISRVVAWFSSGLLLVGSIWLGLLVLLIAADVVGRQLGRPVPGTVELAATSVVAVAFLLMPYTMRLRRQVRSTIFLDKMPVGMRQAINASAYAIGAVVFGLIVVASWDLLARAWMTNEYFGEGALRIPALPTRLMLFLSAAVMTVECGLATVSSPTSSEVGEPDA